jgi:hypothetical protein
MTNVVSLRMAPEKVAAIDRQAADAGLDRTKYLLRLVEEDLSRARKSKTRRRFASLHLLGKFRSEGSSNRAVRAALKARSEENR